MLNEWLWRTASLAAMPTLAPANPFKGFGLPLQGLPPADVKETPQGYSLCVELPGLEAGDVDIRINGDVLTVSGQKGEVEEETRPTYLISERRFGRFERSFPIPPDVERSGIAATFRDGVLSIALPREAGPPAHEEASPAA